MFFNLQVVNLVTAGGGGVETDPVDWIVIEKTMTRVLKDQWISITIASMSLIGLFWLELGVW